MPNAIFTPAFTAFWKVSRCSLADHLLLVDVLLRQAELDGFAEQVVVVVDVHVEVGAVLLGQLMSSSSARLACSMESMPGENRVLDALGSVRVRGDLASRLVRFVGGDLQLFERELRRAGTVALRQHAAGGENLDHVHAVLHLRANDVAHLVGPVGNLKVALRREKRDAGLGRDSCSGRRGPPVMEISGPLATTRGPMMYPELMELRRSTAMNGPSRRREPW